MILCHVLGPGWRGGAYPAGLGWASQNAALRASQPSGVSGLLCEGRRHDPSFTLRGSVLPDPASLCLQLTPSQYSRRDDFQKRTISSALTARLQGGEVQTRVATGDRRGAGGQDKHPLPGNGTLQHLHQQKGRTGCGRPRPTVI